MKGTNAGEDVRTMEGTQAGGGWEGEPSGRWWVLYIVLRGT